MNTLARLLVPAMALGLLSPAMAEQNHGKGMHHSGKHGHGGRHQKGFFKSLTKEQRSKLSGLRLAKKRATVLLRINMKKLKAELVLLITTDKPNKVAINKKLNQLLAAKKLVIMTKINHKITVRKILTAKQRTRFDMRVLKGMMRRKRGCGRHGRFHGKGRGSHGRRHGR